jgi:hypothetical protein
MNLPASIASVVLGLAFILPLRAHRTSGLLQASLVEILPAQVGVEVTLIPGSDVASTMAAMLDADGDGACSQVEAKAWSAQFLAKQSVTVDNQALPLRLQGVHALPLAEMTNGHAQITVLFTANFGELAPGPHTFVHANRYEPFASAYQCNGLVPKSPGVRVASHRRDDHQRELTLAAEFTSPVSIRTNVAQPPVAKPSERHLAALPWLLGLGIAGTLVGSLVHARSVRGAR